MATYEENIRAVLETNLPDIKDEIKDSVAERLMDLFIELREKSALDGFIGGYSVRDLVIFAQRYKELGYYPKDIKDNNEAFSAGYQMANEAFDRSISECIDNMMNGLKEG